MAESKPTKTIHGEVKQLIPPDNTDQYLIPGSYFDIADECDAHLAVIQGGLADDAGLLTRAVDIMDSKRVRPTNRLFVRDPDFEEGDRVSLEVEPAVHRSTAGAWAPVGDSNFDTVDANVEEYYDTDQSPEYPLIAGSMLALAASILASELGGSGLVVILAMVGALAAPKVLDLLVEAPTSGAE